MLGVSRVLYVCVDEEEEDEEREESRMWEPTASMRSESLRIIMFFLSPLLCVGKSSWESVLVDSSREGKELASGPFGRENIGWEGSDEMEEEAWTRSVAVILAVNAKDAL